MAKKLVKPKQGELADWGEKVPRPVSDAAEEYREKLAGSRIGARGRE